MWWKTAKVGDKVVCVRLPTCAPEAWMLTEHAVSVGLVYQVEEIEVDAEYDYGIRVRINDFDEKWENWHCPSLFRPVEPKSTETGFAIIRKILDRAPVKEDA